MTVVGQIATDKKPRKRLSMKERLDDIERQIAKARDRVSRLEAKRARIIAEAREVAGLGR